jgi:membrane protein
MQQEISILLQFFRPMGQIALAMEIPVGVLSAVQRWRQVLVGTAHAATTDRISMTAAGCAFYATLALFPAISMLMSIYGLIERPYTAERQLSVLSEIMPGPAFMLIEDRVYHLVHQTRQVLSLNLAMSVLLTFWTAATGSKSILRGVDIAYNAPRRRGFLRFQMIGLGMTLSGLLCGVLGLVVLLGLPAVIDDLGLWRHRLTLVHAAGMAMLIVFFFAAMVLLYRYGPSSTPERRIKPGALLATVLWLLASEALTSYVSRIGGFGATYGPLGAAVGIMLWFYVSAYATLLGAELNAQLDGCGKRSA